MKRYRSSSINYVVTENGVEYDTVNAALRPECLGQVCLDAKNTGDGYRIKGLLFDYSEAEMLLVYLLANRSNDEGPLEEIIAKQIL